MSETSVARPLLAKYCIGYGADLGMGGDKILPSAIAIDQPTPYTKVGSDIVQLGGDARNLYWFKDGVLDYLYSSHLLEDFIETKPILKEWARVLRKGGNLVLYLPDQKVYKAYCESVNQLPNQAHKLDNFGLEYLRECLKDLPELKEIYSTGIVNTYSFCLVLQKV
jgi:predicted SAM-dependent methyltransferase